MHFNELKKLKNFAKTLDIISLLYYTIITETNKTQNAERQKD